MIPDMASFPLSFLLASAMVRLRKVPILRVCLLLQVLQVFGLASNSVVNLSHYDLMRVDFERMKSEGIVGVIHEATYPRFDRDAYYGDRQSAATRAGLLWGAYHFGDATDPVRQADHFLDMVASEWHGQYVRPEGVLLVLDFEKNGHYPSGTMRVDQAVKFVERIRERTGKYPGVYGSEYRLRAVLNARGVSPAQRQTLANCWLWVANYHKEPRDLAPWEFWHLWQYTGDGVCDLPHTAFPKSIANIRKAERNIFRGTPSSLQTFWREHSWRPAGGVADAQKLIRTAGEVASR